MSSNKTGVVLFQLGGPDSLEAIEPFLYNLFCDPDIIDFPFAKLARKPLAKLISTSRAKHVAHHYAEIGGKWPILDFTRRQSVVEGSNWCLDGVDLADLDIVFSAHSVPVAVIEAGDPYQRQIEHTVDLVWERGGWPARRHPCYQSKVGASKWLRPSMHETVKKLAAAGSKHVLVVPSSFVADHEQKLH